MATKSLSVSRNEVNNTLKKEQKSFEFCVKIIANSVDPIISKYLSERGLSKTYLTEKGADKVITCKADLMSYCKLHTFTAANGSTYQAIYRTDKAGEKVEAKWSVWRVLCAIDAKYKAESAIAGKKAMVAKEESIKAIESEESKPAKRTKKPVNTGAAKVKKQGVKVVKAA